MIRKTVSNYRRTVKTYKARKQSGYNSHTEQVLRETWWFLFIPLYSRVTIEKSSI